MDRLHLVVARINPDLRVVEQRVVRTTYDSLVADITVEGEVSSADEWQLHGLGCRAVVVRRLSSKRSAPQTVRLQPRTQITPPRRPLSAEAQTTWASVAAKPPSSSAGTTSPAVTSSVAAAPPASSPAASPPTAPPTLDDEIPLRTSRKAAKPSAKPATAQPAAPHAGRGIQHFLRKPTPSSPASAAPALQTSAAAATPATATPPPSATPPVVAPSSSSSGSAAAIDADRFNALVAQVENLTRSLAEQIQANQLLQEKLTSVLGECADLRRRLRSARSKRTHSAAQDEPSGSEAAMSSAEEDPAPRRRSPGRDSPANV